MIQTDLAHTATQDFFFRTADRMRVEGCVNAIANDGLSLVLYSPHEPLLDHYLGLLLDRLRRQTPEPRIEVYFPTNTESLIARFNDVLATQTVKEATRQPQDQGSAPQIWVVHDTQHLPDQEIQLMARLIQNFPGANIRAILLMTGHNPQKASLSALGRKVLRWDIEAPTAEQAQLALDAAAQNGQLQAVTQLLRRLDRMPQEPLELSDAPGPELPCSPEERPAASQGLRQPMGRFKATMTALLTRVRNTTSWPAASRLLSSIKKTPLRLWWVLGGALLLSVGLMAWIQPHAFGSKPQAKPVPAVTPAPTVASPASAPQAPEPATEVPDESQQMQAWVKSLPSSSFLIQHGNVMTYAKAVELKKGVPAAGQARIVAAYRPGDTLAHFVIVSGPFESLGKAYESIKRREATKNSWVRTTRSLQDQVNGPTRPQEIRP